jgi:hypothetical protein
LSPFSKDEKEEGQPKKILILGAISLNNQKDIAKRYFDIF